MSIHMKSVRSPVILSGGAFYVPFGEFQKVTAVSVGGDYVAQLHSGIIVLSGYSVRAYGEPVVLQSGPIGQLSGTQVVTPGNTTTNSGVNFAYVSGQGNYVQVTVEKTPTALSGGAVTFAASGDVIGNTFAITAAGE